MKKIITIVLLVLLLTACEKGIHKKYSSASKEMDFEEMKTQISSEELLILKEYILEKETNNEILKDVFYAELLRRAKRIKQRKEKEIVLKKERLDEEKRKNEEKKRKKEEFEAIASKLCNKKWKIEEYAFQLEIPENTPKNIEMAQTILNKSMFIKDAKLSFSLEYDDNKTYVRGKFDERVTKVFSGNNKNWKQYNNDGTYIDKEGKTEEKGTWEVVNNRTIKEIRPSTNRFNRNKKEIVFIKIKYLDENVFKIFEGEQERYASDIDFNTVISMKSK